MIKMTEIISLGGFSKAYLIKEGNSSILVDTSMNDGAKIYDEIKDENIKLIILTHGHQDHVANCKYLAEKLNVPVGMHKADYPMISDNIVPSMNSNSLVGKIINIFTNLTPSKIESFKVDLFLENGQSLKEYGINGVIYGLPGHTKGSIGILLDSGEFIVGDALFNMLKPTPARIYEDKEEMLKSVKIIKKSNPKTIYCGHGDSFDINKI